MQRNAIRQILDFSKKENRLVLTENETKQILLHLGIPFPEFYLAKSVNEAIEHARTIGYPVVLKVVSTEIIHKSDANGVKLNLQNDLEVKEAYQSMIKDAKEYDSNARIIGVSVQKMMIDGTEVIIGMNRDKVFGPVLLFGLGGIFVELLKDVSMRFYHLQNKILKQCLQKLLPVKY
jgi:acyl-CoA synthetase (NDP forming)